MNIVDALFVQLGFDTKKVTEGRKVTEDELDKTKDAMRKTGAEIEERGKVTGEFLGQLRDKLVGLYAVFTAGKGLKSFIADLTAGDSALGRLAAILGISVKTLSEWGGVLKELGGSEQEAYEFLHKFTMEQQRAATTGHSTLTPYLRALNAATGVTISLMDELGKPIDPSKYLLQLSEAFQKLTPAQRTFFGEALGLSTNWIYTLSKGPKEVQRLIDEMSKLNAVTKADTDAAQARQESWARIELTWTNIGRVLSTTLTPLMLKLSEYLNRIAVWAEANPKIIQAAFWGITVPIIALSVYLTGLLSLLGLLFTPIGALVVAIGVLIGLANYFGVSWQSVWNGAVTALSPVIDALELLGAVLMGNPEQIKAAWNQLFTAIKSIVVGFIDWFGPAYFTGLTRAIEAVFAYIENRWKTIKELFSGLIPEFHQGAQPPARANTAQAPPAKVTAQPTRRPLQAAPATQPTRPASRGAQLYPGASDDVAYFQSKGWTREQAIGIVSQIAGESGGRATATGDKGLAVGLGQWHPDRQAEFAKRYGHSIQQGNRNEQLDFFNYELRAGKFKSVGDKLSRLNDALSASELLTRHYEIPRSALPGGDQSDILKRRQLALSLLGMLSPISYSTLPQAAASTHYDNRASSITTDNSSETNIGHVVVNTTATDAEGIAQAIRPALKRRSLTLQANTGLI